MIEHFTENYSVLNIQDTRLVIDGFLIDTEHMLESDADEVYSFTFAPWSADDYTRFMNLIEQCKMEIEMNLGPYSDKDIRFTNQTREGFIRCTQMFQPKVSLNVDHWSELVNKVASLNLWVNDDPTGKLYVNCSYCDPYDTSEDESEDTSVGATDYDDLF